jgi:hypothetical protein
MTFSQLVTELECQKDTFKTTARRRVTTGDLLKDQDGYRLAPHVPRVHPKRHSPDPTEPTDILDLANDEEFDALECERHPATGIDFNGEAYETARSPGSLPFVGARSTTAKELPSLAGRIGPTMEALAGQVDPAIRWHPATDEGRA